MDLPVLHTLVERLRADERLPAFAEALPTRARVAEPALPLLLAALHEELGRGLCVLLGEDTDARDVAEAAGWFLGEDRGALFPSRGGGLVCASALAVAELVPPESARPAPIFVARDAAPGIEGLAENLVAAGYQR